MEIRGDEECFVERSCFSYTSSPCEGEDVVSDNSPNKSSQEMLKNHQAVNIFEKEHTHSSSFASKMDKSEIDTKHLKANWEDKITEALISNVWSIAHCHEKRASANNTEIYNLQTNDNSAMHEGFMKVEHCANIIPKKSESTSRIKEENIEGKDLSLEFSSGINTNSYLNFVKEHETPSACQSFPLKRSCDVECQTDLNEMKSLHKIDFSLRDVACQTISSPKQTADVCTTPLKQVIEHVLNEPVAEDDTPKVLDLSIKKNFQKFGRNVDNSHENIRSREQLTSPNTGVMSSFLPVFSDGPLEYSNEIRRC